MSTKISSQCCGLYQRQLPAVDDHTNSEPSGMLRKGGLLVEKDVIMHGRRQYLMARVQSIKNLRIQRPNPHQHSTCFFCVFFYIYTQEVEERSWGRGGGCLCGMNPIQNCTSTGVRKAAEYPNNP